MRWVLGFAVMLVGLGFAAAAWVTTSHPLTEGSTTGVGRDLLLLVDDDVDDDGVREGVDRIVTYRYEPGGRFAVMLSVRNTSPVPVVLASQGSTLDEMAGNNSFWLEDLAANLSDGFGDDAGVLDQPPMPPTTIGPDEELAFWARYRISPECDGTVPWEPAPDWPGGDGFSSMSRDSIRLETQIAGISQASDISLRTEIQVVNGGPEALLECPTGT